MAHDILMARQPIYDASLNVVAYELLYRDQNSTEVSLFNDGNYATSQVLLNSYTSIYHAGELKKLPAFVNLTQDLLESNNIPAMSRRHIVIEILEGMTVDDKMIEGVQSFIDEGYRIALDDFVYSPEFDPIIRMAHIVKLDLMELTEEQLREHVKILKPFKVTLLAEKIETHAEFELCKELGFKLFQGYFLCRPQLVEGKKLNSSETVMVELMSTLANPDVKPLDIEQVLKKDPQLTFKILRIVNSPLYNLIRKIESVEEAIVLLGITEIKRWSALISFSGQSGKPDELTRHTLIRARMSELLAEKLPGMSSSTAFMMGVVSGLDALLDMEINTILEQVSLSDDVEQAIRFRKGPYGELLLMVDCMVKGEWEMLPNNQSPKKLQDAYQESIFWVTETMERMH